MQKTVSQNVVFFELKARMLQKKGYYLSTTSGIMKSIERSFSERYSIYLMLFYICS